MINIKALLEKHEGFRRFPYKDSVGKLTIGIGRNIEDRGITRMEAIFLLENDIEDFYNELNEGFYWYEALDPVAKVVMLDMAFNMGFAGLKTFKVTLEHLKNHNYKAASVSMLQSKWANQVGSRAVELSELLTKIK